jgi:hypothetical protein
MNNPQAPQPVDCSFWKSKRIDSECPPSKPTPVEFAGAIVAKYPKRLLVFVHKIKKGYTSIGRKTLNSRTDVFGGRPLDESSKNQAGTAGFSRLKRT